MSVSRDTVIVRCPDCGAARKISVRQRRRINNGDRSVLCHLCRTLPTPIPTPADYVYWTERYSMEWIKETAKAMWGDEL